MEINREKPWTGQREEDLGVLGHVTEQPARLSSDPGRNFGGLPPVEAVSPEDKARKEELAKIAGNMIITDEPRGNYFVRQPGL
jgi:hypothetical protein